MPGIICAIRGGPSSQPTIATTIKLASETGETIYCSYAAGDSLSHPDNSWSRQQSPVLLFFNPRSNGGKRLSDRGFRKYDYRWNCGAGRIQNHL